MALPVLRAVIRLWEQRELDAVSQLAALQARSDAEVAAREREVAAADAAVRQYVEQVKSVNDARQGDLQRAVEALTELHSQVRGRMWVDVGGCGCGVCCGWGGSCEYVGRVLPPVTGVSMRISCPLSYSSVTHSLSHPHSLAHSLTHHCLFVSSAPTYCGWALTVRNLPGFTVVLLPSGA